MSRYVGRFAPSPTGPLHAGSLVAALASWLDARAHGGRWLVRIEDVDRERCKPGTDELILQQLQHLGLICDEAPLRQSARGAAYDAALAQLAAIGATFPCSCTRKDIDEAYAARGLAHERHAERIYPGTCRDGLHGRAARATRFRVGHDGASAVVGWHDRRLGAQTQDVAQAVGDFVLQRADGGTAYQLAVVVDDGWQGVTHVVRGEDLADNAPRQILLQRALGLPMPAYLHTPLVLAADGQKLSKQNGAAALDLADVTATLNAAGRVLGLPSIQASTIPDWLATAVRAWPWRS